MPKTCAGGTFVQTTVRMGACDENSPCLCRMAEDFSWQWGTYILLANIKDDEELMAMSDFWIMIGAVITLGIMGITAEKIEPGSGMRFMIWIVLVVIFYLMMVNNGLSLDGALQP